MKNMNYYYDFSGQKFGHPLSLSMNSFDRSVFARQGSLELSYVLKGAYDFMTDIFSRQLQQHELVIIAPGDIHMVRKSQKDSDSVILTVHIDLERFPPSLLGPCEGAFLTMVCSGEQNPELYGNIKHLLGKMLTELLNTQGGGLFALNACMMELLDQASSRERYPIDKLPLSSQARLGYMEAVRYIDENYRSALRLEDVAGQLHFSTSYTSRLFRKYAGIPFVRYLAGVRVRASLEALLGGEEAISRIASDCGMPNLRAYTAAFREMYGVTPSSYRKMFARNQAIGSGGKEARRMELDKEKQGLLAHLLTEIREVCWSWKEKGSGSPAPGLHITAEETALMVLICNEASEEKYNDRLVRLRIADIRGKFYRQERRIRHKTGEVNDSSLCLTLDGVFYREYAVEKNETLEIRLSSME